MRVREVSDVPTVAAGNPAAARQPRVLTLGLVVALIIVSSSVWWSAGDYFFADTQPYLDMADGILRGHFSSEHVAGVPLPETLRTPGYPLFLAACRLLTPSQLLPRAIQLALFFVAVASVWHLVRRLTGKDRRADWVFLGLTTMAVQLPFFEGYINSDSLHISVVALYVVTQCKAPSVNTGLLTGVLAAAAFYLRPAFLPVPVLVSLLVLLRARERLRDTVLHLAVFAALVAPFGFWNLAHHGVFRLTPLEGGGGASHLGYWSFRLPPGYADRFHWGNTFMDDVFNPFPVPALGTTEANAEIAAYEAEWNGILTELAAQGLTGDKNDPEQYRQQHSRFVAERDRLLWKAVMHHAREEPAFFALTRIYTLVRNYFTGLRPSLWNEAGAAGKLKLLAPPVVHLAGVVAPLALVLFLGTRARWRVPFELLLLTAVPLFYGAVHLPFLIGARYTAPSYLPLFAATALFVTRHGFARQSQLEDPARALT